jgi:AP-5 complex subunit mu-1
VTLDFPTSAASQVRQLLNQVIPFGTPIVHDAYFASQLVGTGDARRLGAGYQTIAPAAVPSWKAWLLFPRPQLELKLREVILGSIDGTNDVCEVHGELRCVAQINYLPDITVTIAGLDTVEYISAHYCVKQISGCQVVFSPPTGISQILLWKPRLTDPKPPVSGVYALREDDEGLHFSLTIQAKPHIKNVSVQLPFPGRGSLTKHQFQSPGGQLKMSKKEATVMWLAKLDESPQLTLQGVLCFETKAKPETLGDKLKAYIQIKSDKKSYSGLSIDKDSVSFNANANVNVSVEVGYTTEQKKYVFWETPLAPE